MLRYQQQQRAQVGDELHAKQSTCKIASLALTDSHLNKGEYLEEAQSFCPLLSSHLPAPSQKGRKDQQGSAQLSSSWFHCQPAPAKSACKHQVQHHAPTAGHTFHLSLFPTIPTASLVYNQVEPPQKHIYFDQKFVVFLILQQPITRKNQAAQFTV